MAALHVSISAEPIAHLGPLVVTNSLATGAVVSLLILLFCLYFASKKKTLQPGQGLQNVVELIIEGIYNLNKDIAGDKKARIFFPLIATYFIFVFFNNLVSVLPGVGTIGVSENEHISADEELVSLPQAYADNDHPSETLQNTVSQAGDQSSTTHDSVATSPSDSPAEHTTFVPVIRPATADISTTLALALISVILTQYYGIKFQGFSYFTKFFNFKQGPIFTFAGFIELISEFAKIISFAFRLFGNIFAGEVLLAVTAFLIPLFLPIPFLGLEIFVGFIQALVFAMLTLVFINMATIGHDDH